MQQLKKKKNNGVMLQKQEGTVDIYFFERVRL